MDFILHHSHPAIFPYVSWEVIVYELVLQYLDQVKTTNLDLTKFLCFEKYNGIPQYFPAVHRLLPINTYRRSFASPKLWLPITPFLQHRDCFVVPDSPERRYWGVWLYLNLSQRCLCQTVQRSLWKWVPPIFSSITSCSGCSLQTSWTSCWWSCTVWDCLKVNN